MTPANRLVDTFNILATVVPNYPAWRKAIEEQSLSGFPPGGEGVRGSGPGDPVWAAYQARDEVGEMALEFDATIAELHGLARILLRRMRANAPVHDHTGGEKKAMFCELDPLCERLGVRKQKRSDGVMVWACWSHYSPPSRQQAE